MQRTVAIKLAVTEAQSAALADLAAEFARGCNAAVAHAVEGRLTNRVKLHHRAYYPVRETTRLGAQMTCNVMRAVASAYKTLQANGRLDPDSAFPTIVFGQRGAVHFDKRTYTLDAANEAVSLYTLAGRIRAGMRLGAFQRAYLSRGTPKEAKLVARRKGWFLHLVLDVPEAEPTSGDGVLAVDLGENNLAATSTGLILGGGALRDKRDRFLALRKRLQRNGSQSAKQRLKAASGRECRHVRHVNQQASRSIVAEAQRVGAGTIVLENLTNIRERIRGGKRLRTRLHRWPWRQLQALIEEKAAAAGIRVRYVNPAYSSQTCAACGAHARRRKHQLRCDSCGNRAHADGNAAANLARLGATAVASRGAVNHPHVAATA